MERAKATSTSDPRIDRVTSEIHAFRAEAAGRTEVVHRDFDELRREVREELDAIRQALARGLIAIAVLLVLGFLSAVVLVSVNT